MDKNQFVNRTNIILDRNIDVVPIIDEVLSHWSFDLFTRRPGAALTADGVFKGTDLDLACFMSALVDRGAVINIPKYKARRVATQKEGERVVSKDNRHGKCMGLTANKEAFSFSIRINDANVMTTEDVGAPRNFMLVDVDGVWYEGWKCIEFMPNREENDFLKDKKLWTGYTVQFKNFVHPNRWISFYGRHYILTKLLIQRLGEQAKFLGDEVKRLQAAGVRFPTSDKPNKVGGPQYGGLSSAKTTKVGAQKSIKIDAFEAEIGGVEFKGEHPKLPNTSEALKEAADLRSKIIYNKLPALRFATRATELAFHLHGEDGKNMPAWTEGGWTRGVKLPKKRKEWNEIELFGFKLRYRTWKKSERVAA